VKVVVKNLTSVMSGKSATALRGTKLEKKKKIVSIALGSMEFFSVGLAGKIETNSRRRLRDVITGH
jgi:hypothetical protein